MTENGNREASCLLLYLAVLKPAYSGAAFTAGRKRHSAAALCSLWRPSCFGWLKTRRKLKASWLASGGNEAAVKAGIGTRRHRNIGRQLNTQCSNGKIIGGYSAPAGGGNIWRPKIMKTESAVLMMKNGAVTSSENNVT